MSTIPQSYSVHGAPYLPWTCFFKKIAQSEVYVVLDNVPVTNSRSFFNRCKLAQADYEFYLTIPISRPRGGETLRRDVAIVPGSSWARKHMESFRHSYGKSAHWYSVIVPLLNQMDQEWKFLLDLNVHLIRQILERAGSRTQIVLASSLPIDTPDPTERLVQIGRYLDLTTYVSGIGGLNYMDNEAFAKAGIRLIISEPNLLKGENRAFDSWMDRGLTVIDEISQLGGQTTWSI